MLELNQQMSFTQKQSCYLYFANAYNWLLTVLRCPCQPVRNKMTVLYQECEKRMDKHLDIIKLVKDIKYIKLLLKRNILQDTETKFQIHHSAKNVIDLDKLFDVAESSKTAPVIVQPLSVAEPSVQSEIEAQHEPR